MKRKAVKGYWEKRRERFNAGADAKSRAGQLRSHEHVAHVTVEKDGNDYVVHYSIAKWYLEELRNAGGKL